MSQALDGQKLEEQIHELYRREHAELGERGTLERLERGREWDLAPTLVSGGVVVFPHAGVLDCGHQVAAAVHGCLDSGADRVDRDQRPARVRGRDGRGSRPCLRRGGSGPVAVLGNPGPGIDGRDEWRDDHALISFRHFWAGETKRRGIPARRSSSGTRTSRAGTPSGCRGSRSSPRSQRTQ